MPLESWYVTLQWAAAMLVGITFLVGIATVWVGDRVNKRQAERVLVLEKETADAKRAYLELQERTKPRGMREAHLALMRKYLSEVPRVKKLRVEIVRARHKFPITENSEVYAEQLFKVIKETGFDVSVTELPDSELPRNGIHGMLYAFGDSNQAGYFFAAIQGALIDAGIPSQIQSWPSDPQFKDEELVRIVVGLEP